MGRQLSTTSGNSLVVNVRGEKGETFTGELVSHKQADSQYTKPDGSPKPYDIYQFKAEEGTMSFQKKVGKEYVSADDDVEVGTLVDIFASTRLNNALRQVKVGERVTITYLGLGKATGKGGRPHDYQVELL